MGIITPYGTGPSPIWYGAGYISQGKWWALGAMFGALYLGCYDFRCIYIYLKS